MLPLSHMGITTAVIYGAEKLKLLREVDYRWVLFGAILPDIIDKPLKWLLWEDSSSLFSGRYFGHTLLFALLLLIMGIFCKLKLKNNTILILALSCFIHDVLDAMWLFPVIFYWPVFGTEFRWIYEEPWWIARPYSFVPETICGIGFVIMVAKMIRDARKLGKE